jgi:hypothetical protein
MSCTANAQCQSACGTPAAGYLFCCDTSLNPGLCYASTAGSCALVGMDAATTNPGRDAAATMCTGPASCGGNQVCCLRAGGGGGGGAFNATCQSAACNAGRQVCMNDADCPANQNCARLGGGGGLRTCQ